jgi:hypothetical protein
LTHKLFPSKIDLVRLLLFGFALGFAILPIAMSLFRLVGVPRLHPTDLTFVLCAVSIAVTVGVPYIKYQIHRRYGAYDLVLVALCVANVAGVYINNRLMDILRDWEWTSGHKHLLLTVPLLLWIVWLDLRMTKSFKNESATDASQPLRRTR